MKKELKTESSHTTITDDLLINLLLELAIGGIIFYFSYAFYISLLEVSMFLKLSLIVFFASFSTILSSIISFPIIRYISKKAQHEKKGFRDLHPKLNIQYLLTFILNLILTSILIMLGFYIYIGIFIENQSTGIAVLIYLSLKLIIVLLATFLAYILMRSFKTQNKKARFKALALIIILVTIYAIMIIFAIMFIFLE